MNVCVCVYVYIVIARVSICIFLLSLSKKGGALVVVMLEKVKYLRKELKLQQLPKETKRVSLLYVPEKFFECFNNVQNNNRSYTHL